MASFASAPAAEEFMAKIDASSLAMKRYSQPTQSDPARAGQLAKQLITSDAIDFMLTTSTPETVNPVSDACEAAGVPCLSTVMPWEAWYFGRGAKPGAPSRSSGPTISASASRISSNSYVSQWSALPTNKKLGVLYPNDADGNAIREHLAPALEKAGYTVIDPGEYEDGTTDYAAQIAKFKAARCEVFNTFPIPPDFAAFWRQAAQQGYSRMGEDRAGRQDRPVPVEHRGPRVARGEARQLLLLASRLPLQLVAHRLQLEGSCRWLRDDREQAMEPADRGIDVVVRRGIRGVEEQRNAENDKAAVAKALARSRRSPRSASSISPAVRSRTFRRAASSGRNGSRQSRAASTSSTYCHHRERQRSEGTVARSFLPLQLRRRCR